MLRPIVVSHTADPDRPVVDGVTVARCGALMPASGSSGDPVCVTCRRAIGLVAVTDPGALACRKCGEDRLVELETVIRGGRQVGTACCAVCGYAWRVRA
jgi:hypothetical protein